LAEAQPADDLLERVRETARLAARKKREFDKAAREARAAVLAAARAEKPFSRRQIAAAAGVTRQRIDQILTGRARATDD
jgi:hypothetical protein